MAGSLTNYAEQKLLDHATGTTSYTMPSQLYAAAFTVSPGEAGGGTEATGGSYARQAVDFDAASGADPSATENSNVLEFPTGWAGTVTAVALFDASSSGNMIWWFTLNNSKTIDTDDVFRMSIGSIDLTMD